MKQPYLVALMVCLSLLVSSTPVAAQKLCGFRNVDIYFDVTGIEKGKVFECYREYCNRHCIDEKTHIEMGFVKQNRDTLQCVDAKSVRRIDRSTTPPAGTIADNPWRRLYEEGGTDVGRRILEDMGAEDTGQPCTAAGVTGRLYKHAFGTFCLLNGIVIASETGGMAGFTSKKTATKIDKGPKTKCGLPEGIAFKKVELTKAQAFGQTQESAGAGEQPQTPPDMSQQMKNIKEMMEQMKKTGIPVPEQQQ